MYKWYSYFIPLDNGSKTIIIASLEYIDRLV